MNEKLLPADIPSPESLFAKLTSLAYSIDPDFRRGESDVLTYERSAKKFAGQLVDEFNPEQKIPLYNEKVLNFKGSRAEPDDDDMAVSRRPVGFTIRQEIITQIEAIPEHLRPHLDDETIEQYDMTETGDLNVVNYVDYTVTSDDGEVDIQRNIGYALRDIDTIIFEASEVNGQPEPEYIAIAHQQQSLRFFHPIKEEAAPDQVEQISFNAVFDEIFDGRNQLFFSEFVERRQDDATLALVGLINCIKGRHAIPKELTLPSSDCEEVNKIS